MGERRLKKPDEAAAKLERARAKLERLTNKVTATQAKLEKRTRKLRAVESKIAQLERRGAVRRSATPRPARGDKSLRRACLIYNPKAEKKGESLEQVVAALHTHGIAATVDVKTSSRAARAMAKAALKEGFELVIVAGGDSTIEEVVPALVGSSAVLGIVPVGTMNNVARSLGIPLSIDGASALLGAGSTRQIDVGHVHGEGGKPTEYFLETAGLGLSAIAFSAGEAAQKGPLTGLPRALAKLFDHKPDAIQVELDDGHPILANAQLVTVSNAPLMGLNFLIAPRAKMDDGLLDVAVYDGMSKTELIEYFVSMRNGQPADDDRVRFYRSSTVRIVAAVPEEVESDKNPLPEKTTLQITVLPRAITAVVGSGPGLSVPVEAAQEAQHVAEA